METYIDVHEIIYSKITESVIKIKFQDDEDIEVTRDDKRFEEIKKEIKKVWG